VGSECFTLSPWLQPRKLAKRSEGDSDAIAALGGVCLGPGTLLGGRKQKALPGDFSPVSFSTVPPSRELEPHIQDLHHPELLQ
jgi:hypothetical protein